MKRGIIKKLAIWSYCSLFAEACYNQYYCDNRKKTKENNEPRIKYNKDYSKREQN
ncbi:MAG: hypothetical protein FWD47_11620 [Treponema sp.]|nr:hypothetical protein [Treponema sp.]